MDSAGGRVISFSIFYSPHALVNTICQSVKSENGDMLMLHNPTQGATAYYSVAHIRYFRIHAHFMIHFMKLPAGDLHHSLQI